jgi:penicillin-binding protein 1C
LKKYVWSDIRHAEKGSLSKRNFFLYAVLIVLAGILLIPVPDHEPALSKAIYSREGVLLSATVSSEQQWCFPMDREVPDKLKQCIVLYEDAYMDYHPGINPVSVVKAFMTNIKKGTKQRGASTLAMQVMRIKNRNAQRSWLNKIREGLSALKYSLLHTDQHIIREWCALAPFGGNTIGVKAASLRYFGREIEGLSWAEYALLAVMPNGPATANLTKNREQLKRKRDFLLRKLQAHGSFEKSDLQLYLDEPLPEKTTDVPQEAYHALMYAATKYPDKSLYPSRLSADIQRKTGALIEQETAVLKTEGILNAGILIIDVVSNEVIAYHGNAPGGTRAFHYVDMVQARRSYGSLLKPLLYAHVVEGGHYLPNELVADIPTAIGGFQPENFDKKYRGAVRLGDMVTQSLNIPAVRVLHASGQQTFYNTIERMQLTGIDKGTDHYGLSIILGGAETTLWELGRMYKGFARNYAGETMPYNEATLVAQADEEDKKHCEVNFSAYTMAHLVDAMADLTRPREEKSWQMFGLNQKIAWKTGTSYGHRDAWAIGFNARYMVGVWTGNESGEGRFGLTGIEKAAPMMFRVFHLLPGNRWFPDKTHQQTGEVIAVCAESGRIAGALCKHKKNERARKGPMHLQQCDHHQEVLMNQQGKVVTTACNTADAIKDTVFVLPPMLEYYYRHASPVYTGMPPSEPGCDPGDTACKIIYPQHGVHIFLPKESPTKTSQLIAKAHHRDPQGRLYWFVDQRFVAETRHGAHECMLALHPGKYVLSITDERGHSDQISMHIISSDENRQKDR